MNFLENILKMQYSSHLYLCFSGGTLRNLKTTQRIEKF